MKRSCCYSVLKCCKGRPIRNPGGCRGGGGLGGGEFLLSCDEQTNFLFMFPSKTEYQILLYAFPIMYVTIKFCRFFLVNIFSSILSTKPTIFSAHIFYELFFLTFVAKNKQFFFIFNLLSPPLHIYKGPFNDYVTLRGGGVRFALQSIVK